MNRDYIGELFFDVELFDTLELCRFAKIPTAKNGTKCLIKKNGSVIIGQMEAVFTFSGSPIQINNPANNPWVQYLNNDLSGKKVEISGQIVYSSSPIYRALREDAKLGLKSNYSIEYLGGESFTASFVPINLSDSIAVGTKLTSSITLQSSGTVVQINS